jgi:hypothetical protein
MDAGDMDREARRCGTGVNERPMSPELVTGRTGATGYDSCVLTVVLGGTSEFKFSL